MFEHKCSVSANRTCCTCFSVSSCFKFLCLKSHHHHQKGALRRAADRVPWREILSERSNKVQNGRKGANGKGPTNVTYAHVHLEHFKAFFPLGNSSSLFVFHPLAEDNEPPCMTVLWKPGVYNQGENEMEHCIQPSKQTTLGGKRVVARRHGENRPRNKTNTNWYIYFSATCWFWEIAVYCCWRKKAPFSHAQ